MTVRELRKRRVRIVSTAAVDALLRPVLQSVEAARRALCALALGRPVLAVDSILVGAEEPVRAARGDAARGVQPRREPHAHAVLVAPPGRNEGERDVVDLARECDEAHCGARKTAPRDGFTQ